MFKPLSVWYFAALGTETHPSGLVQILYSLDCDSSVGGLVWPIGVTPMSRSVRLCCLNKTAQTGQFVRKDY